MIAPSGKGIVPLHDEVHFVRYKRNDDLAADRGGDTRLHVACE